MKRFSSAAFAIVGVAVLGSPLRADWDITTIDTGTNNGWFPSIALDAGDNPRVAYLHFNAGTETSLKYAQRNAGIWSVEAIETAYQTGWEPSLALDSTGKPRIAYLNVAAFDLKYAEWDGSVWFDRCPGGKCERLDLRRARPLARPEFRSRQSRPARHHSLRRPAQL